MEIESIPPMEDESSDAEKKSIETRTLVSDEQVPKNVMRELAKDEDFKEWAKERQEELGKTHGEDPSGTNGPKGRAKEKVAKQVGLGSRKTYERAKKVRGRGQFLYKWGRASISESWS